MHICWKRFYLSSPIEWVPHVNCFLSLLVEWICFRLLPFSHTLYLESALEVQGSLNSSQCSNLEKGKYILEYLHGKVNKCENTWNFKLKYKFQVFRSRQDRKTNSFVCFMGEVLTQQFCFEIYWSLWGTEKPQIVIKII